MFPSNSSFPHLLDHHVFPSPLDSFSNHDYYDVNHFNYLQMNHESSFHAYNNSTPAPPDYVMQNVTPMINQDFLERSGLQNCEDDGHENENDDLLDSVISSYKKKMVAASSRKDGHSKINTAQGPRDRRVRFSIEIARKFFGLQDLLGFDRASKTLDWLLTNSATAIKALVEETNNDQNSFDHESKLKFLETIIGGGSDHDEKKKSVVIKSCVDGKKKEISRQKCKGGSLVNNAAREQSRAEARARARERTRAKMRVKKIEDDELLVPDSKLTVMNSSGGCSIEIDQPLSHYKDLSLQCIMDHHQETMLKHSKDPSILYTSLYQNLEYYFMTTSR